MKTWNDPKELEQEILGRCHIEKNGWVNMDSLTVLIPYLLLQRCGRHVAFEIGPTITGIVTPPSRGVPFADRVAEWMPNLVHFIYPRRDPYKTEVPKGFIPLTVLSPSHGNQPMDYIMPAHHNGNCLALFVDDVLSSGATASMFISFILERWPGWQFAGAAFLVEKVGMGGRERLKKSFDWSDGKVFSLAKIDVGGAT